MSLIELWNSGAIRTPQWMWVMAYGCSLAGFLVLITEAFRQRWRFRFFYLAHGYHYFYVWCWSAYVAIGWDMSPRVSALALSVTSVLVPASFIYSLWSKDRL